MVQRSIAPLFAAAFLAAFACNGGDAQCTAGVDCASGACDVTGHCVAVVTPTGDAGAGAADEADTGVPVDGAAPPSEDAPTSFDDSGLVGCVPDHNGTITQAELPMLPGLHATYLAAENVTWDTAGTVLADGSRVWDLTGALSGDHDSEFDTIAPGGAWWAGQFTGATFAVKISDTQTLLGVFEAGAPLQLLGVVSPSSGTTQTELTYATPIATVQVPLSMGTTWQSTSNVTGTADGVISAYSEQYANKVDAYGTLKTPFGTFDVLRVQTTLTRTVGIVPTVTQSFAFMAECFGAVANVTSQSGETSTDFSNDAEVRRLTP